MLLQQNEGTVLSFFNTNIFVTNVVMLRMIEAVLYTAASYSHT